MGNNRDNQKMNKRIVENIIRELLREGYTSKRMRKELVKRTGLSLPQCDRYRKNYFFTIQSFKDWENAGIIGMSTTIYLATLTKVDQRAIYDILEAARGDNIQCIRPFVKYVREKYKEGYYSWDDIKQKIKKEKPSVFINETSPNNTVFIDYPAVSNQQTNYENGRQYRCYVKRMLEESGHQNVREMQDSHDDGADILCEYDGVKYAVQCKYSSKETIGIKEVKDAQRARDEYNTHVGVLVSNARFSVNAIKYAQNIRPEVVLWNTHILERRIRVVGNTR